MHPQGGFFRGSFVLTELDRIDLKASVADVAVYKHIDDICVSVFIIIIIEEFFLTGDPAVRRYHCGQICFRVSGPVFLIITFSVVAPGVNIS